MYALDGELTVENGFGWLKTRKLEPGRRLFSISQHVWAPAQRAILWAIHREIAVSGNFSQDSTNGKTKEKREKQLYFWKETKRFLRIWTWKLMNNGSVRSRSHNRWEHTEWVEEEEDERPPPTIPYRLPGVVVIFEAEKRAKWKTVARTDAGIIKEKNWVRFLISYHLLPISPNAYRH